MSYPQHVKELAYKLDPVAFISYSGKPREHKRWMDARRTEALRLAALTYTTPNLRVRRRDPLGSAYWDAGMSAPSPASSGEKREPAMERTITIPACEEHAGYRAITVKVPWSCLVCGEPRGVPFPTTSYDGSTRLAVDGWANPCGHVEKYSAVRAALQGATP